MKWKAFHSCLKWGNTLPVVSADDEGGKQLPRWRRTWPQEWQHMTGWKWCGCLQWKQWWKFKLIIGLEWRKEINPSFSFRIWGIFMKNMTETLMLWRTVKKECIFTLTLVVRCEITTFTAKCRNYWEKGGPNNSGWFLRMYMTSSEKPGKRAAGLQPVFFPSSSPHLSRGCCLCLSVFVWNGPPPPRAPLVPAKPVRLSLLWGACGKVQAAGRRLQLLRSLWICPTFYGYLRWIRSR